MFKIGDKVVYRSIPDEIYEIISIYGGYATVRHTTKRNYDSNVPITCLTEYVRYPSKEFKPKEKVCILIQTRTTKSEICTKIGDLCEVINVENNGLFLKVLNYKEDYFLYTNKNNVRKL